MYRSGVCSVNAGCESERCVFDQVEHPQRSKKAVWHKLLSKQRKRAVVACFRMAPLYNLPRYHVFHLVFCACVSV